MRGVAVLGFVGCNRDRKKTMILQKETKGTKNFWHGFHGFHGFHGLTAIESIEQQLTAFQAKYE